MTEDQRKTLTRLVEEMRQDALAIGPLHAWWQTIDETNAFLQLDDSRATPEAAAALIEDFQRGLAMPRPAPSLPPDQLAAIDAAAKEFDPVAEINLIANKFDQYLNECYNDGLKKVELAMAGMLEEIEGRVPSNKDLPKYGDIVSIQGLERVTFFIWKRKHVLSWIFDISEGETPGMIIKKLDEKDWPPPLVQYIANLPK